MKRLHQDSLIIFGGNGKTLIKTSTLTNWQPQTSKFGTEKQKSDHR
jgi:hypothetical protein